MIDLYYWTTPNGHKVTMFLEEANLPYKVIPINIGKGEQFDPGFLKIAPNNRIPAMVDHEPVGGGARCRCSSRAPCCSTWRKRPAGFCPRICADAQKCCSGCSGRWAGSGRWRARITISASMRPRKIPYAIERYTKETNRLYGVLNRRLADRAFVAGDEYSIADMASIRGSSRMSARARNSRIFRT
jgi:GST-like protein